MGATKEKKRQFFFTSISRDANDHEMDQEPSLQLLNEKINLADYGAGLKQYYCTFLTVPPDDEMHFPFEDYDPETKEVDVAVSIPFDLVKAATEREMRRLAQAAFLEGIDQLAALSIPDFDVPAFKLDVMAVWED